jgi:hypothetical protein
MSTKKDKCIKKKIEKVMHEFKEGSLKRRDGKTIKSRKEAVAIALNVAKKKCSKKK